MDTYVLLFSFEIEKWGTYSELIAVIIAIVALILSIFAYKVSLQTNAINFESTSEWRKRLLDIASSDITTDTELKKSIIGLRACSRFELPENCSDSYEFQSEISNLYDRIMSNNYASSDIFRYALRIQGLARVYLKISWEANQPHSFRDWIKYGLKPGGRRKRKDAKYNFATKKYYEEFLKAEGRKNY